MAANADDFDFFEQLQLTNEETSRLCIEMVRLYPQLRDPHILSARALPIYRGHALLYVQDGVDDAPHNYWFLGEPPTGRVYVIEEGGEGLDRVARIAPLVLPDLDSIAHFLRLRFGFMKDSRLERSFRIAAENGYSRSASDGSAQAKVRLSYASKDHGTREADVVIRLEPGVGIVSAHINDRWRQVDAKANDSQQTRGALARVSTPYFVDTWPETRRADDADSTSIPHYEKILGRFNIDPERSKRSYVRATPLIFYRTFKLYEVVVLGPSGSASAEVGYCLGRPRTDSEDTWEFLPIDGSSAPIHDANKGDELLLRDIQIGAELGTTADPVAAYIRFFCWAVEGDEGPFFTPQAIERLELSEPIPIETLRAIESTDLVPRMKEAPRESPYAQTESTYLRRALTIYAGTAFVATFEVTSEGLIEMTDDKPLNVAVPLDVARMSSAGRRLKLAIDPTTPEEAIVPNDPTKTDAPRPEPITHDTNGVLTAEHHVFSNTSAVLALLTAKRAATFHNCRFAQGLALRDFTLGGTLHFSSCVFECMGKTTCAIDLEGAELKGSLIFEDCHIRGELKASHSRIEGSLSVLACSIATEAPDSAFRGVPSVWSETSSPFKSSASSFKSSASSFLRTPVNLDLSGATVGHDIFIGNGGQESTKELRTIVTGNIVLRRAHATRSVRFRGLWCGGMIDVASAHVEGDCVFGTDLSARDHDVAYTARGRSVCIDVHAIDASGLRADNVYFGYLRLGDKASLISSPGHITLQHACISTDVGFYGATIGGELLLYAASIEGNVAIQETSVSGNITFTFACVRFFVHASSREAPSLWAYSLKCDGDLTLSGAKLGGLELSGARILGDVVLHTGTVGTIYVYPSLVELNGSVNVSTTRMRRLSIYNATIEADVRLYAVSIGDTSADMMLPPDGVTRLVERLVLWLDNSDRTGLRIENSTIRGNLSTLPMDTTLSDDLRATHKLLFKSNGAVRERIHELERHDGGLRAINRTVVGDVYLRANHFESSVELRDLTVYGKITLADSDIDIDLMIDGSRPLLQGGVEQLQSRCVEADMEKVTCRGDADLTGLSGTRVMEKPSVGGLQTYATGSGGLRMRGAEIKGDLLLVKRESGRTARFEGTLDLSTIKANRVVLTGENVVPGVRVVLDRSDLSQLEIIHPTPSSIDLTAIKVARWKFGSDDQAMAPGDPVRIDDFIEILSPMEPFDRSVWISVESELRNQARESDANEIYRAMRERGRRYLTPSRRLLDRLSWLTISYGTRPWLPLLPLIVAFVALAIVFSDANNVTPTSDMIQAQGSDCSTLYASGVAMLSTQEQLALESLKPACERLTPAVLGYAWSWMDGVHLALQHSVPVITVLSHETWQAAHRAVVLPRWAACERSPEELQPRICRVSLLRRSLAYLSERRSDTLASLVSLYAWIAVPISLVFFGSRVIRAPRQ